MTLFLFSFAIIALSGLGLAIGVLAGRGPAVGSCSSVSRGARPGCKGCNGCPREGKRGMKAERGTGQ